MKKIVSSLAIFLFVLSMLIAVSAAVSPDKVKCYKANCCGLDQCTAKCGGKDDCVLKCQEAQAQCIHVKCKITEEELFELTDPFSAAPKDPCK
jgi:hypothetical protein